MQGLKVRTGGLAQRVLLTCPLQHYSDPASHGWVSQETLWDAEAPVQEAYEHLEAILAKAKGSRARQRVKVEFFLKSHFYTASHSRYCKSRVNC